MSEHKFTFVLWSWKQKRRPLWVWRVKAWKRPHGKGGISSQKLHNVSKFLFQSTISPYKHICSFLRENHLSERWVLKILVKVNLPSRSTHTSKVIFTKNNFDKFDQKSSFVKITFRFDLKKKITKSRLYKRQL